MQMWCWSRGPYRIYYLFIRHLFMVMATIRISAPRASGEFVISAEGPALREGVARRKWKSNGPWRYDHVYNRDETCVHINGALLDA